MLIKKSNWMMRDSTDAFIPKHEDKVVQNLTEFNKFLKQNNIDFYVLIVPAKFFVYYEVLAKDYYFNHKALQNYNQWINHFVKSDGVKTVYPYKALRKARYEDFVFFKQTHHWTEWGAYIGYRELMKMIAEDYPDIHIASLDEYNRFTSKLVREDWSREFNIGQTTNKLRYSREYAIKHLLKDDYVYYNHKNMVKPKIVHINYHRSKYYKNDNLPNAPRAMVVGTSQTENLMQFLPYSFSELKYCRINNVKKVPTDKEFELFKRFKNDIIEFKPDILVLSITTGNIPYLTKMMTEN